ncbi:ABC-2 type transporter-domain-containing protein [Hyaloraphidium curvatum]|nr:ABC-2 type transporter-domain-containing protein [Hyaloraphidium curvatum]
MRAVTAPATSVAAAAATAPAETAAAAGLANGASSGLVSPATPLPPPVAQAASTAATNPSTISAAPTDAAKTLTRRKTVVNFEPTPGVAEGLTDLAMQAVGLASQQDNSMKAIASRNPSYADILALAERTAGDADARLDPADPAFDFEYVLGKMAQMRRERMSAVGLTDAQRRGGVVWKGLAVQGIDLSGREISTVVNAMFSCYKIAQALKPPEGPPPGPLLQNFTGFVGAQEMALVLGKPGSGCSTFLRALAGQHKFFKSVTGEIKIAGVELKDFLHKYKGQLSYSGEDDYHYATLTVRQTLDFALRCRIGESGVPYTDNATTADVRRRIVDIVMRVLGLTKAANTIVGNAYVRGVSGGERKRVSIAEQFLVGSTIGFYDGSTKGLDSASALDFVSALRLSCDYLGKTIFASLYQASEAVYEKFHRVILIAGGRCIYCGPTEEAKAYFERMGFVCPPRATTPDFLTGVTVPAEQVIRPGMEGSVPKTPAEFEARWLASPECAAMMSEMSEHDAAGAAAAKEFDEAYGVYKETSGKTKVASTYSTTYGEQLVACLIREGQLLWGGKQEVIFRTVFNTMMAIIVGSVYFQLPFTGTGAFSRGGVLFFALLFNSLAAQSEIPGTMDGRQVLYKHKSFVLYQPMIYYFAKVVWDIPIKLVQILFFTVIFYFMVGLNMTDRGVHFGIFYFVLFLSYVSFAAFCRMMGTYSVDLNSANRAAGIIMILFLVYNGYLIPFNQMPPWFGWIVWVNPLAYGYKALALNEFVGQNFYCSGSTLIPPYPNASLAYQTCTIPGAVPGQDYVSGQDYLNARFGDMGHLWINVLALAVFFIGFTFLAMLGTELIEYGKGGISVNVYKKQKLRKKKAAVVPTPAATVVQVDGKGVQAAAADEDVQMFHGRPFTWMHLNYFVPVQKGQRQLLQNVAGYVVPGRMVALMGSSGAGKTTLLDVLAQRKTIGKVEGEVYLGSSPQGPDFKQITGYAEQMDVHMPTQTVREALVFSAELRQPPEISKAEKLKWVEEVIDLLEMRSIGDAMIGTTESGLGISVEERKRLTIAVELVAKPEILFLDEPTSGLDSTASYSIVRLIKKLTKRGQAVICTIHQPSAVLFEYFDDLLLLGRGGRTIYFGAIGDHSNTLLSYFERYGCPKLDEQGNPAEYILDAINGREGSASPKMKGQDEWVDAWNAAPEKGVIEAEIEKLRSGNDGTMKAAGHVTDGSRNPKETAIVTERMLVNYYRQPNYNVGRAVMQFATGLILGLTFFRVPDTYAGLQNRMFALFQTCTLGALVISQVQPSLIEERKWFNREVGSGFYSWRSFFIAILAAELPFAFLSAVCFYIPFYFLVGLPLGGQAAYFFLLYITFTFFCVTLGQSIAAFSPNIKVAAIINPIVTSIMSLFAGITIPVSAMPVFWSSWIYWLSVYHYYLEGALGSQLGGLIVTCAPNEFVSYNPPPGLTCGQWSAGFLPTAPGYLENPSATSGCLYCPVATGDAYLELQLSWSSGNTWRNYGILLAFTVFNVFTTAVFVYRRRKGDPR